MNNDRITIIDQGRNGQLNNQMIVMITNCQNGEISDLLDTLGKLCIERILLSCCISIDYKLQLIWDLKTDKNVLIKTAIHDS